MLLFGFIVVGCSDNDTITIENETTQEGAFTLVLKGYESASEGFSVCQPEGFTYPFYIQDKTFHGDVYWFSKSDAGRLDAMPEVPVQEAGWQQSVDIEEDAAYWAWCMGADRYRYLKFRVIDIEGNNVTIEYVEEDAPAGNWNANAGNDYVTEYEMPCLNDSNVYVTHDIEVNGNRVLNYALEWNAAKRHANWVAFSFDAVTVQKNVSRTDAWNLDPQLPGICPEENDHKSDGFDKGHLCASEDRVYSKEANEQTFYYSNMSPQMSSFNGGFWASFEILVQDWARSNAYDKVYVAKGGTLDQLLVNFTGTRNGNDGVLPQTDANGFTKKGLACPKYYFMAVLSEKGSEYHAIGFWMEHRDDYGYEYDNFVPSDVMKTYAVSIDELEKNTGLDFFCNLPDDVEDAVEASWNEANWTW